MLIFIAIIIIAIMTVMIIILLITVEIIIPRASIIIFVIITTITVISSHYHRYKTIQIKEIITNFLKTNTRKRKKETRMHPLTCNSVQQQDERCNI